VILVDDQVIVGFNRPLLEQALSRRRPGLGVSVADAAKVREEYRLTVDQGALVGSVKPGSLAERVCLRAGDVIIEIDGYPIRTAQDVTDVMARIQSAREIAIVWVRGNKTLRGSGS